MDKFLGFVLCYKKNFCYAWGGGFPGDEYLSFIAGSNKRNYNLSTVDSDYYVVYVNGKRTDQTVSNLTWNIDDKINIVRKRNKSNWYRILHEVDWDAGDVPLVGSQFTVQLTKLEPKHWLSPLPNLLPDDQFIGILRCFYNCTTLESVCDYLFENTPNTNNLARIFEGCTNLRTVPGNIFKGIYKNLISPTGLFANSGLETVPLLFNEATYPNCNNVNEMFMGTKVKTIPRNFFKNFTKIEKITRTFANTPFLESVDVVTDLASSYSLTELVEYCNNSKVTSISGVTLDLTKTNTRTVQGFWGNTSTSDFIIQPVNVKVIVGTQTASILDTLKQNASFKDTFNVIHL